LLIAGCANWHVPGSGMCPAMMLGFRRVTYLFISNWD